MRYLTPDYFDEFSCVAGACEDTCCAGWQIVIDDESMHRYQMEKPPFKSELIRGIHWFQKTFKRDKEGRCAFLDGKNLCDIYANLGENALCKTCRMYPRHVEEFENVRETTLSLSCPEVARLLLTLKAPVTFKAWEDDEEEEFEDFDPFLYSVLLDARDDLIGILQTREWKLHFRAFLCLAIAHDLQVKISRGEMFSCEAVLRRYKTENAHAFVKETQEAYLKDEAARYYNSLLNMQTLYELERLSESWTDVIISCKTLLLERGAAYYCEVKDEFDTWVFKNLPLWSIWQEQFLVYFIFTYFCGAVYDGRVYGKTQMAMFSLGVCEDILCSRWLLNGKMLDGEDVKEIWYRYSRELEHSDRNLEMLEKIMEEEKWIRVRQ